MVQRQRCISGQNLSPPLLSFVTSSSSRCWCGRSHTVSHCLTHTQRMLQHHFSPQHRVECRGLNRWTFQSVRSVWFTFWAPSCFGVPAFVPECPVEWAPSLIFMLHLLNHECAFNLERFSEHRWRLLSFSLLESFGKSMWSAVCKGDSTYTLGKFYTHLCILNMSFMAIYGYSWTILVIRRRFMFGDEAFLLLIVKIQFRQHIF